MQISANRTDEVSLVQLGVEAVQLLCSGNIQTLVTRFGYALSLGRECTFAVRHDLSQCLAKLQANNLVFSSQPTPTVVKRFEANDIGLLALVECLALTDNGAKILVELIVSSKGSERHVTLEQLSVAV